ncbi:MAG TPA: IS4 family transposase [Anaerolineales bacterium]|jgi:DDE family transposase|nr:IS4 family transposase [Anaerolineales bacterium]
MDRQQVTTMANKFQAVLDVDVLNERGQQLGLAKRKRLITPFRLGLSVIASMATQQVQTIADLHRQFNELWQIETDYNAFYKQLDKATAPVFFLDSLCAIMSQLTLKVLGFEAGKVFSEFNRLLLQDGSSFALHKALAHVFPGRFHTVSPAAVELHCTLDLLQDAPITIALSPDTDSEHDYRPEPKNLRGDLLLADRGYLDLTYLREMARHGGFFIVRGKSNLNPRVIEAYREDGQRLQSCQGRDFQAIISKFPKQQRTELEVEWLLEGEAFRVRQIVSWNPKDRCFTYLLTNLPKPRYTIMLICLGYKLRWQIELLFKEWKSYTNLHKFDTEKETISESLIWSSLCASAIKRFLAHATEHLLEVVISTRKASMPSAYGLPELFKALRHGDGPWYRRAFESMVEYLGNNAKRAHPKRDARTGRARLGLKSIFQLTDQKAVIDNYEQPAVA